MPPSRRFTSGQASVEFVALFPLMSVVVLCMWQLVLAGHAVWAAAGAARVASRAVAVGGDARAAARGALPARLERRLAVRVSAEGAVEVRVRVPVVVRGVDLGSVSGRAGFGEQK